MKQYCGNCKYWNPEDKCSVGCRCECPGLAKYRHHESSSYKQPSNGAKCNHFVMDPNKNYKPKEGNKMAKNMKRYYVAFIGQSKDGGVVFGNDTIKMFEPITAKSMEAIREFIGIRKKLNQITILNLMEISED